MKAIRAAHGRETRELVAPRSMLEAIVSRIALKHRRGQGIEGNGGGATPSHLRIDAAFLRLKRLILRVPGLQHPSLDPSLVQQASQSKGRVHRGRSSAQISSLSGPNMAEDVPRSEVEGSPRGTGAPPADGGREGLDTTSSAGKDAAAAATSAEVAAPPAGLQGTDADALIASEADLEAFGRQPVEERVLTGSLRGVLAETAITGVVRYKWPLLRPLVEFAMDQVRCMAACMHACGRVGEALTRACMISCTCMNACVSVCECVCLCVSVFCVCDCRRLRASYMPEGWLAWGGRDLMLDA
jgi:hypothetical protein